MTVIKRGFLYITRKRGRSILLLVIMFVAAALVMLGLAVKQSADRQTDAIRKNLGNSFILDIDKTAGKALWDHYGGRIPYDKRPRISAALMSRLLKMDHITGYYTDEGEWTLWAGVELYPGSAECLYRLSHKHPEDYKDVNMDQLVKWMHVTPLRCCSNTELNKYFRNGAFTLKEGRHVREDDVNKAVISTELARRNNLSVGDTFNIDQIEAAVFTGGSMTKTLNEPITLEIVGLFDMNFSQEPAFLIGKDGETYVQTQETDLAQNIIYSDMATYRQLEDIFGKLNDLKPSPSPEYMTALSSAVFYVDDPKNLEAAMAEVKAVNEIDWNYFFVKADDSTYKTAAGPLKSLGAVSSVLIAVTIVGCLVILGLTLNMWTKSRKREVGILMSLGVSKRKLVQQQLLESLTLAVAALVLAAAVSAALTGSVGSLANRLASPGGAKSAYSVGRSQYEYISIDKMTADPVNLTYTLSAENVLLAAAAILGSTALSVGITARNITKLKPKAVLRAM